jgi:hypothetical protein
MSSQPPAKRARCGVAPRDPSPEPSQPDHKHGQPSGKPKKIHKEGKSALEKFMGLLNEAVFLYNSAKQLRKLLDYIKETAQPALQAIRRILGIQGNLPNESELEDAAAELHEEIFVYDEQEMIELEEYAKKLELEFKPKDDKGDEKEDDDGEGGEGEGGEGEGGGAEGAAGEEEGGESIIQEGEQIIKNIGEKIGEGVSKAGQAIEEGAEAVGGAVESAGESIIAGAEAVFGAAEAAAPFVAALL